jgi:hypothetical protein
MRDVTPFVTMVNTHPSSSFVSILDEDDHVLGIIIQRFPDGHYDLDITIHRADEVEMTIIGKGIEATKVDTLVEKYGG